MDVKKTDYIEWILNHPGQVVLTISQVIYTRQVNQALDSGTGLTETRDQMVSTIINVCALVFAQLEHTKLLTVEALLTLQVHWRDIFEMLIKHHVRWILKKRFLNLDEFRSLIKAILNGKNIFDMIGMNEKQTLKFSKLMPLFSMAMNILVVQVD